VGLLALLSYHGAKLIGQTLSHFKITAKLGEGGMGEVYRAEDTKLGREVAIKVLPEAFVQDAERLARFEREAHVLASLNHPNIAAIHDLAEDQGTPMSLPLRSSTSRVAKLIRGVVWEIRVLRRLSSTRRYGSPVSESKRPQKGTSLRRG
jgi:serine/threonine protein kinase